MFTNSLVFAAGLIGDLYNPGAMLPTLCKKVVGFFLTSHKDQHRENAGDKMIRMSNHTHMSWQRQHILLHYFKTLSALLWGSNPQLPLQQPDALQHVLTVKMLKSPSIRMFYWAPYGTTTLDQDVT